MRFQDFRGDLEAPGQGDCTILHPTGFSTDGPSSMTSNAATALEDHGMAVVDFIESAHHLSAIGRRKTLSP